ncbi:MAG: flavin-containing monooxygenase [Gammaproteobacteria bacterium]
MGRTVQQQKVNAVATFDVVVVGAGFAGLFTLYRLRNLGFSVRVYDEASDVGGTWYWNRYPGARCDVESMEYSYAFSDDLQQEWEWTERYPTQPEILRYLRHVAMRFDLRRDIQFQTLVTEAIFDEATRRWQMRTDQGDRVSAQFCIAATGCLSTIHIPQIPGFENFIGDWYHTGRWPHEGVDFTGRKVGCIGVGSSGIQVIPIIAKQAAHLYAFQRTPQFSVPAHNAPLDREYVRRVRANYGEFRRQQRESFSGLVGQRNDHSALSVPSTDRQKEYEARWNHGGLGFLAAFADLLTNEEANDTAAEFVRAKIRSRVHDPGIAAALSPRRYPLGTKRLSVESNYYETFNRDNVTLVDIQNTPITGFTAHGLRTRDAEYAFDSVVFATGFDAMTGALLRINICGRDGCTLRQRWAALPRSNLGIQVSGFPNLFTITGPASPSVLSNMVVSIEQQVDWIADCLSYLRSHRYAVIETTAEAEDDWMAHVDRVAEATLFPRANSWYMGANIPGKQRGFMPYVGGVGTYRTICTDIAASAYKGFILKT